MIFASSALWASARVDSIANDTSARVAQQRMTPFLSDMSDSGKARSSSYGQLMARLDSKRLKHDEPLAPYTTFRIGGPADLFYDATSADDLANAISAARQATMPFFLLGLGANILVGDGGFRGLVIRNAARHVRFAEDGRVWCETGVIMRELIAESVR